ncbi:MAG: hypothetical protein IPK99_18145 [Flavobacteriales bacterium]|nr:hypothetical protein [Flavobacteriales bacterium]
MKTFLALSSFTVLAACGGGPGGREVELTIDGAAGRTVYFDRFENNKAIHVDSVKLSDKGEGTLHVPSLPLDFYRISLDEGDALIVVLDSSESLGVKAVAGSLSKPTELTGSPNTTDLHDFYKQATRLETTWRASARRWRKAPATAPRSMD